MRARCGTAGTHTGTVVGSGVVELPTGLKIAAPAPQPAVEAAPILPHFGIDFM
jgi:hypothetical protein